MKNIRVLAIAVLISSVFTACTKEGDTINNYNVSGSESAPPKKMLKQLIAGDTSTKYTFSYYNNNPDKMQELVVSSGGVPSVKLTILFNSAGKAEGYQVYTLPANTLSGQGTFKLDAKERIIEMVNRQVNGDTSNILYLSYQNANSSWQPSVASSYSKSSDRITDVTYINYDKKGNVSDMNLYRDNGSDPVYLDGKVTAVYSDVINPLPRVYYFLLLEGGIGSSSPLFLSNYMPFSVSEQEYNMDGSADGVDITSYNVEADADGHATRVRSVSGGGSDLMFKY